MKPRMRAGLQVAAAVLLLALFGGCGLGQGGTTLTAGDVTVIDEAGLVEGLDATDPGGDAFVNPPSATAANGHLDEVLVVWVGSSCDGGSVLHLRGNALTLEIAPKQSSDDGCSDRLRWITLLVDRVVDASSITISQVEG